MARDANKKHGMVLLVDTRLSGARCKAGDEVELYGDDADRLEARRIVEAKPQPKKQPAKKASDDAKS